MLTPPDGGADVQRDGRTYGSKYGIEISETEYGNEVLEPKYGTEITSRHIGTTFLNRGMERKLGTKYGIEIWQDSMEL